ncbi:type IV pilus modification PilV family protein [Thiocapsa bogorovii]|uniref:type IV pilus modification PilV family protein n=1 Tax=Thiocapsa bogorovii TaxID=521689 RepID=UPI001E38F873|nr:hypothetical protein [Thiocapsa bogorovii]UHD15802.1 hypothetical protein LT988_21505 [Thiocapsa bogorovii]
MPKNRVMESMPSRITLGIVNHQSQSGASLLEALIAMIVVSVGLLGVAGLQMRALQSANESAGISNETILANDFGERLWAVARVLADADESDRIEIVTRTRNQWIRDHDRKVAVDDQEDCTLPECCPDPICFIDEDSFALGERKYVQPGAQHPSYIFQIDSSNIFSVVLPTTALISESSQ